PFLKTFDVFSLLSHSRFSICKFLLFLSKFLFFSFFGFFKFRFFINNRCCWCIITFIVVIQFVLSFYKGIITSFYFFVFSLSGVTCFFQCRKFCKFCFKLSFCCCQFCIGFCFSGCCFTQIVFAVFKTIQVV